MQVWQVEKLGREEVTFIAQNFLKSHCLFKRAAERYADIPPDELERRRRRGWGEGTADVVRAQFHISFSCSTNLCRIFLKTVSGRPQRQGLRLPPRLCNCALTLTVTPHQAQQAHQSSQMGSLNTIPRSR